MAKKRKKLSRSDRVEKFFTDKLLYKLIFATVLTLFAGEAYEAAGGTIGYIQSCKEGIFSAYPDLCGLYAIGMLFLLVGFSAIFLYFMLLAGATLLDWVKK